ncbi:MAG: alpha-amylase family glycosyl hydrolase [Actinomycetota bacterium]
MPDPASGVSADAPWWHGAVGYEVYIRSFADSDGDGVGDLPGIVDHLDHLAWLGVDIVWITPCMPSPGFDHGYDVADYCDIDPLFGDLADFDRLVERTHELGMRLLVDLVPNHSSSHHPWFLDSRSATDAERRDWYVWADGRDGGPPNNWVSHFGGPAWTYDENTDQWYCHLFLPEQPDLNWANPAVRDAFDDVLRFWCERGADGFRIDVAHSLSKNLALPDNPQPRPVAADAGPSAVFESFDHHHDLDQDETVEIFERWHEVVAPYGAMLVGEVNVPRPERSARYTEPGVLDTVFYLKPAWANWRPDRLLSMLTTMHDADPDGLSWTMNSHDTSRSVTRFGGGETGLRRTLAITTLQFALGGVPFLYQGEELGLADPELDAGDRADPIWTRNEGSTEAGRDGARSGVPWAPGPGNGFTTGTPWLRAKDRRDDETVEVQCTDPSAPVHRYRELIAVRAAMSDLVDAPLRWLPVHGDDAVAGIRGDAAFVANLGPEPVTVDLTRPPTVRFSSADAPTTAVTEVTVAGETSVLFDLGA